jgi:hypothetical protein
MVCRNNDFCHNEVQKSRIARAHRKYERTANKTQIMHKWNGRGQDVDQDKNEETWCYKVYHHLSRSR